MKPSNLLAPQKRSTGDHITNSIYHLTPIQQNPSEFQHQHKLKLKQYMHKLLRFWQAIYIWKIGSRGKELQTSGLWVPLRKLDARDSLHQLGSTHLFSSSSAGDDDASDACPKRPAIWQGTWSREVADYLHVPAYHIRPTINWVYHPDPVIFRFHQATLTCVLLFDRVSWQSVSPTWSSRFHLLSWSPID